jgi:phosphatidylglycerophosphate synthase
MASKKFQYITEPDNFIQIVFRMLSTIIVRYLVNTSITPNQVTIARSVIVVGSLIFFAKGDPASLLWAVVLFYIFEVLDHVDGDLARATQKFSRTGPLLEQFIDTWSSRASNIFGFCVAIGMYNYTGSLTGIYLFALTAFGRMQWLEYRDEFGWTRVAKGTEEQRQSILRAPSVRAAFKSLFVILYTWNNTFLLAAALFYIPMQAWFDINALVIGFTIVAVLNNVPWVAIVAKQFIFSSEEIQVE